MCAGLALLMIPALGVAQESPSAPPGSQESAPNEVLAQVVVLAWREAVEHMRADRPRAAIPILERLVTIAPAEHRFRLELARAYFLVEDDEKATFHFDQSLGADLPEAARDAVMRYQDRIRERRRWEARFSFSIAPESNPARRTDADTITLLGAQFTLDQEAETATALHSTARLTYFPRITRDLSARFSVSLDARVFDNSDFNDIRAGLEMGLIHRGDGGREVGAGVTASRRWIGTSAFSRSLGVYGSFETRLATRTKLRFRGDIERLRHDGLSHRDGTRKKLQVNLTHVLTPTLGLRAGGFVTRTDAESDTESGLQSGLSLGATYVFDGGLVTSVDLGYTRERRDGASALFQRVRSDRRSSVTVGLLHREVEFRGFAPRLDLMLERRSSTIELYDFENARISLGLTRSF